MKRRLFVAGENAVLPELSVAPPALKALTKVVAALGEIGAVSG